MALSEEYLLHITTLYNATRNLKATAAQLGIPRQTLQSQLKVARDSMPHMFGEKTKPNIPISNQEVADWSIPKFYCPDVPIKKVLIGGDAHLWPGEPPIMWKAFVKIAKKLKPDCIVLNGDILDGARVSRYSRLYGSRAPSIMQELETVTKCLKMLPTVPAQIWTMGNHELRFDNYLMNNSSELEEYAGSIRDRFPQWKFCWATNINDVEIRHRFRGGIHTGWNNALHSGVNMVTNHTHQLQMTAVRNRNGSHYGIEAGMLGDPYSPAFEYTEGAPSRTCPGFVLLSFDDDGNLMPPELAEMVRGRPVFRGEYVF